MGSDAAEGQRNISVHSRQSMQEFAKATDTGVLPKSFPPSQRASEGGKHFRVAQTRSKAFQQGFFFV